MRTKAETIELCARFMGYMKHVCCLGGPDYWRNPEGETLSIKDYDPTADTPQGREQANKLLKKIWATPYMDVDIASAHLIGKWVASVITPDAEYNAKGSWWNSALASAVASLQEEIEREKANAPN